MIKGEKIFTPAQILEAVSISFHEAFDLLRRLLG